MNKYILFLLLFLAVIWVIAPIAGELRRIITRKRLTSFRLHPEQLPLATEQPLPSHIFKRRPSPIVLTKQLSIRGHILLLAIWLGMSVFLALVAILSSASNPLVNLSEILGLWTAYWIVLHGLLTAMFYQHIEANESGLLVQRGVIRHRIPWDQARLFAIDYMSVRGMGVTSTRYELSSSHQIIHWERENSKRPLPQFTLKPTPPEYQQEAEHLKSFIREKTDLSLREFSSLPG